MTSKKTEANILDLSRWLSDQFSEFQNYHPLIHLK